MQNILARPIMRGAFKKPTSTTMRGCGVKLYSLNTLAPTVPGASALVVALLLGLVDEAVLPPVLLLLLLPSVGGFKYTAS